MAVWFVLLRGVNVGGHNKLKMADFKAALTAAGLQNVQTYIQSGNVVFRSDLDEAGIAALVEKVLNDGFGLMVPVLILSEQKLSGIVEECPFQGDPSRIILYFCFESVEETFDDAALQKLKLADDEVQVARDVVYFHAPEGIGRSKLAEKMDRLMPVQLTARNIRSARTLLELAEKTC